MFVTLESGVSWMRRILGGGGVEGSEGMMVKMFRPAPKLTGEKVAWDIEGVRSR